MREKQNSYLFTAGILVFAFLFMPLSKFVASGEVFSILDFQYVVFIQGVAYKYFIGGVLSILLAALIFVAVTLYRNALWQQRMVIASLVLNTLLIAFIIFKYYTWEFYPKYQFDRPALQFGVAFPLLVELMLAGALQQIRRK